MIASTKLLAFVPAAQTIKRGLVLLSLLVLLALSGAGVARSHSVAAQIAATNGDILIGSTLAVPAGVRIGATNGDIHVGEQAATNGTIHIGGLAETNGEIHVGA
ncbi:MAG TPA: hypothetical protein VH540_28115 [Ktedonobacterales bacterium]|jgi:hypothetical protein